MKIKNLLAAIGATVAARHLAYYALAIHSHHTTDGEATDLLIERIRDHRFAVAKNRTDLAGIYHAHGQELLAHYFAYRAERLLDRIEHEATK